MSIPLTCECGQTFHVKEELAGRRGKCPKCGRVLTIPHPSSPPQHRSRFSCTCGETIWAKESLAGKKVKCPKWGEVVLVSKLDSLVGEKQPVRDTQAASPVAQKRGLSKVGAEEPDIDSLAVRILETPDTSPKTDRNATAKTPSDPSCTASETARTATAVPDVPLPERSELESSMATLFDEADIPLQPSPARFCPSCSAALLEHALLCVACGFNLSTGEKLRTPSVSAPSISGAGQTRESNMEGMWQARQVAASVVLGIVAGVNLIAGAVGVVPEIAGAANFVFYGGLVFLLLLGLTLVPGTRNIAFIVGTILMGLETLALAVLVGPFSIAAVMKGWLAYVVFCGIDEV